MIKYWAIELSIFFSDARDIKNLDASSFFIFFIFYFLYKKIHLSIRFQPPNGKYILGIYTLTEVERSTISTSGAK